MGGGPSVATLLLAQRAKRNSEQQASLAKDNEPSIKHHGMMTISKTNLSWVELKVFNF